MARQRDPIVEEALRSTREFIEPAVRHGLFTGPDPDRRDILCGQVKNVSNLPPESRAEILAILKTAPRSRGRSRAWRNLLIVEAVRRLVASGHFAVTRSEATRDRECACSIVAEVLKQLGVNLKERGIEDIVRVRG